MKDMFIKFFEKITCKHDWILLSETISESKFQHALTTVRNLGGKCKYKWQDDLDTTRKHIQICTCKKCGKIKRYVEVI